MLCLELSPVFGLRYLFQRIKWLHFIHHHITCTFASGHGAFYYQEWGFEFILLAFVNLRKDHQRDMAELMFHSGEDNLTAGQEAAEGPE